MTRLIDTGEFLAVHQHGRLTKVNAAPMSLQKWHPEVSVLFKLADGECLLYYLVADAPVSSMIP